MVETQLNKVALEMEVNVECKTYCLLALPPLKQRLKITVAIL
jgi:hypothetical protein